MHVRRAPRLWLPRSHQQRQATTMLALDRIPRGVVQALPPLRDVVRPLSECVRINATAELLSMTVRASMRAVLFVARQKILPGGSHRRKHHEPAEVLQVCEQDHAPVLRPDKTALRARPLLAGSRGAFAMTPLPRFQAV